MVIYRNEAELAFDIVQGRDLIEADISPDEKFSNYPEYAHKLRLAWVDKSDALKYILSYIQKRK